MHLAVYLDKDYGFSINQVYTWLDFCRVFELMHVKCRLIDAVRYCSFDLLDT